MVGMLWPQNPQVFIFGMSSMRTNKNRIYYCTDNMITLAHFVAPLPAQLATVIRLTTEAVGSRMTLSHLLL